MHSLMHQCFWSSSSSFYLTATFHLILFTTVLKTLVHKEQHLDHAWALGTLCVCFNASFKKQRVFVSIIVILSNCIMWCESFDNSVESICFQRVISGLCAGIRESMIAFQDILQETKSFECHHHAFIQIKHVTFFHCKNEINQNKTNKREKNDYDNNKEW